MKTTLAALALAVLPALASAQCLGDHSKQVMSCAAGSTWDAQAQACVPTTG